MSDVRPLFDNCQVLEKQSVKFYIVALLDLKVLLSDKLSGDGIIFQVWPYLNSLIIIKLTFFQQEHVQSFPPPSPSKTCALAFDFALDRDPKNIFYYQHDVENYTDWVLNFLLFDRHEYIYTRNLPVCNSGHHTYVTGLINFFFVLQDLTDRIDSYFQRIAFHSNLLLTGF